LAIFTLGKNERLKSRKLIESLFESGRSFSLFPYRVTYKFLGQGKEHLQAGFGVSSRNFKRATDRNRIKRLGREAYRHQKAELSELLRQKGQSLIVFFIFTGKELPDQKFVSEKISLILQRLVQQANEKYPSNT
jgi:ribonuclease P protein component